MNTANTFRYPVAVRWIHWLGVLAIAAAYLTSESAEHFEESPSGVNWHVVAGLGLLLLFIPHVVARMRVRHRPVSTGVQKWLAGTIHLALLLFMVVQPMLGILSVWANGDPLPIPFTGFRLQPLLQLSSQAHALEELHETVGNAFYGVIGLHVLAALWHQFVRRDRLLQRML